VEKFETHAGFRKRSVAIPVAVEDHGIRRNNTAVDVYHHGYVFISVIGFTSADKHSVFGKNRGTFILNTTLRDIVHRY